MKLLSTLVLLTMFNLIVSGQDNAHQKIDNQIIIHLKESVNIKYFLQSIDQNKLQLSHLKNLGIRHNIHLFQIDLGDNNKASLLSLISLNKNVIAAQFNYVINYRNEPNDFFYPEQWDMEKINLPETWELSTGGVTANGDTIVLAILDSGFDISHPDLKDNVWQNNAEIPSDGIDNDGNGYIDDYYGWNFKTNSNEHGIAGHGHGVAGIMGAKGNNQIGITGVNWNIKLLLLDAGDSEEVIAAYEYILDLRHRYNTSNGQEGAFVIASNASWGSPASCDDFPIIKDLFDTMGKEGILTVAATINEHLNIDQVEDFPTSCPSDYLLTVTNTSMSDEKVPNSGFGKISIDMGVPGDDVYTIKLNDDYGTLGGASAATPHLTGAVGLLYSIACTDIAVDALTHPAETALLFKKVLMEGVDPVFALQNYTASGGRLNVFNSAQLLSNECKINIGDLNILNVYPNPVSAELTVEYQAPDFEDYFINIYNVLGQIVFKDKVSPSLFSKKLYKIEVERFPSGLYTFEISRNNNRVVKKFVVGK